MQSRLGEEGPECEETQRHFERLKISSQFEPLFKKSLC